MWSFPGAFDKLRIWWNRQSIINQVPKKLYSCGTQLQSAASQSADSRWTRHRRARVTLRHISSLELYEHVNFTLSIFLACKTLSFLFFFIFHIFLSHANHPLPTVQWALRMRPVVNDSDGAGATLVFVTCQHNVCRAVTAAGYTCDWRCQWCVNWRVGVSRDQKKRRGIWTVAMFITKSINHETCF